MEKLNEKTSDNTRKDPKELEMLDEMPEFNSISAIKDFEINHYKLTLEEKYAENYRK